MQKMGAPFAPTGGWDEPGVDCLGGTGGRGGAGGGRVAVGGAGDAGGSGAGLNLW